MDADFWDTRYRENRHVWSGRPNPQLVAEVTGLAPGRALDAGCGEGADAIWLAQHGWRVTAVDFSSVALAKGAAQAGDLAIDWRCEDVTSWRPPQQFDLVSAQFLHVAPALRERALEQLAAAVVPGGTLLVVGHHRHDVRTPDGRERHLETLFDPEDIALDPSCWRREVSEARARTIDGGDGAPFTQLDTVVRAVRLA